MLSTTQLDARVETGHPSSALEIRGATYSFQLAPAELGAAASRCVMRLPFGPTEWGEFNAWKRAGHPMTEEWRMRITHCARD
jgi:hypothetical protein